jgi:nitrite reductase/ring-hydroxylating ferredoxin subunit
MEEVYIKIADSIDELPFGENGMCEVVMEGKTICLAKVGTEVYGCAAKCPHASGIMSNGFIDPLGNIVCPLHRYKFDLKNGRNSSGEGYYLKTYKLKINDSGVFVVKEKKKGFFDFLA